jgi:hypothetical protein
MEVTNTKMFIIIAIVFGLLLIGGAFAVYDPTKGSHDTLWTDRIEPKTADRIIVAGDMEVTGQLIATTAGSGGMGGLTPEVAGDRDYYPSGHWLGGATRNNGAGDSWTTSTRIRFIAPGQFRFVINYMMDFNNRWTEVRILNNGMAVAGPYRVEGTTGGDPWHSATNDINVGSGDIIEIQGRNEDGLGAGQIQVWMRGEHLSGIYEVQQY